MAPLFYAGLRIHAVPARRLAEGRARGRAGWGAAG
jgi:hypothetical protein